MRTLSVLLALLAWLGAGTACATATRDDPAGEPGGFVPESDSWEGIMEDVIGPIYDDYLWREAERSDGPMDFATIAAQAERAADHVALGHGVHERTDVPRFAQYARETEAWFRRIAAEATEGDAEQVRKLILEGQLDHCDRCHTAAR